MIPKYFISTTNSLKDIDWWFWVLMAIFPTGKFIFMWWLFRSPKRSAPVTSNLLEGKVLSVTSLTSTDPIDLTLELDGELDGNGKLIPLIRANDGAHEHSSGGFRFEPEDSAFLFAIDSTAAGNTGDEKVGLLAKIKGKKTDFDIVLRVTLRGPEGKIYQGESKPKSFESLATGFEMGTETINLLPEGNIQIEFFSRKIESNIDRLLSSRKMLSAAFRQQKLLLVTSHIFSLALSILLVSFGVRFLFSGAFSASVVAISIGGLFALSSIPVLCLWAALGTLIDRGQMRRFMNLNSQARAYLGLLGGLSLVLVAAFTANNPEAVQNFSLLSLLQVLNGITFAVHFVKFEAENKIGALFHLNCFKRPIEVSEKV